MEETKKKVKKSPIKEIPEIKAPTEPIVQNLAEEVAKAPEVVTGLVIDPTQAATPEDVKKKKRRGATMPKTCFVSQYAMNGRLLRTFPSIKDAVMAMEISERTILDYINGKRYQTGGYMWGYEKDGLR
jgi:hypothetical protein